LISEFAKLTECYVAEHFVQHPGTDRLSPQDAIKTFSSASFDGLVLENHLVLRD